MKKNFVVATTFLLVLAVVAGGVWKKQIEQKNAEQPVVSKVVRSDDLPGSHLYPIRHISGETYTEIDEKYGISMELPVEFEKRFERENLSTNQVSIEGYQKKIGAVNPVEEKLYRNIFTFSFNITEKSKLQENDNISLDFQKNQYPAIKNLKVGEKLTYEVLSPQEKKEILGEDYTLAFNGDIIYTSLGEINSFKVYSYDDMNESSATYGYVAVLENEKFLFSIFLFSFYPSESTSESRNKVLMYYKDFFYSILQSFKYTR
jgi:hypothetical protein